MRELVTQERLKTLLHYDPDTGLFRWRVSQRGRAAGSPAGGPDGSSGNCYLTVYIDGLKYRAHRLAWFYVHGTWPKEIDHENRIKSDTRLVNLREVTRKQNAENTGLLRNNTSGVRGVTWNKKEKKWAAQIKHNRQLHHLGWYRDFNDAVAVRLRKERELFTHSDGCR